MPSDLDLLVIGSGSAAMAAASQARGAGWRVALVDHKPLGGTCALRGCYPTPLTPVSGHDGRVVVANILQGNHRKPDYRGVPSVAFTIRPIARGGLGEAKAPELGLRFRVETQQVADWYTARQAAEPAAGFKVLVEEPGGRILGAHLLGPHADESINAFALAVRHGLTADDLKQAMFAYSTSASDIGYML